MRGAAVVLGLLTTAGALAAQQQPTWWMDLGIGAGSASGPTDAAADIAAHVGVAYQFGPHVLSVRTVSSFDEFVSLVFALDDSVTSISDAGFLYGRGTRPGTVHASLAAGVGFLSVTRGRGAGDFADSYYFTVPLAAQVAWRPGRTVGVVLSGYASLNGEESMYGATVGVQVGRLR